MATKKVIVYYELRRGGNVNRSYVDFDTMLTDQQNVDQWKQGNPGRMYIDHEDHADYTWAFAAAGMVGADNDAVRDWLRDRCDELVEKREAAKKAKQATMIPGHGDSYGGLPPGSIVRDQHGRSGKVPEVPLETFRNKPIDPDKAMEAVRAASKGGGGR